MNRLLNAEETGKLLGVSTRTLYTLSAQGKLPCIKVGRSVRYDQRDIDTYINQQRSPLQAEMKHG